MQNGVIISIQLKADFKSRGKMMETFSIGEIAQRAGVKTSAIRYYESIGLLNAPERLNGQRRYHEDVLTRLNIILAAREMGFSLDEVRTLIEGCSDDTPPSDLWQKLAAEKLPQVEVMIAQAQRLKQLLEAGLRCECVRIEDCFAGLSGL
jgi:MerR family transcriptional regulator, redox-sensitive transcriptional activator SoxR